MCQSEFVDSESPPQVTRLFGRSSLFNLSYDGGDNKRSMENMLRYPA